MEMGLDLQRHRGYLGEQQLRRAEWSLGLARVKTREQPEELGSGAYKRSMCCLVVGRARLAADERGVSGAAMPLGRRDATSACDCEMYTGTWATLLLGPGPVLVLQVIDGVCVCVCLVWVCSHHHYSPRWGMRTTVQW